MAKKDIERLEKRIELLEMQIKELKSVEPDIINQRFKSIEDTLYSTKDILNMKEVCQYLDISQSLLYKLTCNGEIPHFKPRGKLIFFEKKALVKWIMVKPFRKNPNNQVKNLTTRATMKKKTPRKNSIDGTNLPDSRLVELLDRCIISVKDIKRKTKKKQYGTESEEERTV